MHEQGFFDRVSAYLAEHQEQAFILKAFGVILTIILLQEFLGGLIGLFIILFPVIFLMYIKLQAATTGESANDLLRQHITFMPTMYTDGERKKDGVGWVTYLIIFLNVLVFFGYEIFADPQWLMDNLLFIPHQPNLWNVPVSLFTAMFLHAGVGHLVGNIVFLWAIGTVVEKRVGHGRFLALYLTTGVAAGLFGAIVTRIFMHQTMHGLGASGAIAGIMGVFAVRCYFKSMVFPVPILGVFSLIFPISLKVRLNSLVIIGLFFLSDLSGGVGQIAGTSQSNIGHWIHIGGMLAGMGLAAFLDLGAAAIDERHLELGERAVAGGGVALGAGEDSLRLALRRNPNNIEALLLLARIQSRYTKTEEGRNLYLQAVRLMIRDDPHRAAEVYCEYFEKYLVSAEPALEYRLFSIFQRKGDLDMASRCLETVVKDGKTPPAVREKGLFQLGRMLEEMGFEDAARDYYQQFVADFPQSMMAPKAQARLAG